MCRKGRCAGERGGGVQEGEVCRRERCVGGERGV